MSSQDRTDRLGVKVTAALAASFAGTLALSGCTNEANKGWLPGDRDVTNHTAIITDLWVNSWIAALAVGIITWSLILWCVVAYRRKKGSVGFPRQLSYNLPLEVFYLTIPLLMVLVFFYFTNKDQQEIDARTPNPDVVVNVYGKQWAWDFNYRQSPGIAEDVYEVTTQVHMAGRSVDPANIPTLYLPVGKKVELQLSSRDVNHSFWVPAFLQKRDLIPGKMNYIDFTPQQLGTYDGKCAELCGEYHSEMLFRVKVVSQEEFTHHLEALARAGHRGNLGEEYDRNPNRQETK